MIDAAGGVVWRRDGRDEIQVLLVHRPEYDDWSLPKGKLDPGETHQDAAVREVGEETGLHCQLGPELHQVRYSDHLGRPKSVRYWAMTVTHDEGFEPGDEVDELRWLDPDAARAMASYEYDRDVLDAFEREMHLS